MNENTLISVHCYAGDAHQVQMLLPVYEHHGAPVVILSPVDSQVHGIGPHICRAAGKRAYIGQDSLDRQIEHLKILLEYPFDFFLLNDSDSFCVARELPAKLFEEAGDTLWANMVTEPRPHESPYPKLAAQPPYFIARHGLEKLVAVSGCVKAHPITPYIDWQMVALSCEAGLRLRAFTELEHPADFEFSGSDPWDTLRYRIGHMGSVMCHPIKTKEQLELCVLARKHYESRHASRGIGICGRPPSSGCEFAMPTTPRDSRADFKS